MAKAAKKRKQDTEVSGEEAPVKAKARSAKKLLMAAVLMCVASLGGGFFLARMAYLEDVSSYEPDYVDEQLGEETAAAKNSDSSKDGIVDPLAKDGHPAEDAMALKKDKDKAKGEEEGKEGEIVADNGLLDFGDLLTNIQGVDAQGAPTKAFLKVAVVLVYRTDPGAAELVRSREPFMRDLFNGYLRGLHEADVRGMAGVLHVKAELLKRARAAVGSDLPQEILINDLIVQ